MGWAPSYNPFLLIGVAIPGVILYGLYLYALHRLLLKTGLSQKLLLAAVLIDLVVSGPQRTLMWPVFGPHFLVGLFLPADSAQRVGDGSGALLCQMEHSTHFIAQFGFKRSLIRIIANSLKGIRGELNPPLRRSQGRV